MRFSLALLCALVGFASLALPAGAIPRYAPSPSPFSTTLGCQVKFVPRQAPAHKGNDYYAVMVVNTLDHPLGGGTAILYGVNFPDGSMQNATGSLSATIGSGGMLLIGYLTPALAPTSCRAGIPAPPPINNPSSGVGTGRNMGNASPRPVMDPI